MVEALIVVNNIAVNKYRKKKKEFWSILHSEVSTCEVRNSAIIYYNNLYIMYEHRPRKTLMSRYKHDDNLHHEEHNVNIIRMLVLCKQSLAAAFCRVLTMPQRNHYISSLKASKIKFK